MNEWNVLQIWHLQNAFSVISFLCMYFVLLSMNRLLCKVYHFYFDFQAQV